MGDDRKTTDAVTLTIDGREVTVPRGTTILQAAETLGNRVPHYCYHPALSAPAQCRLCLVEVEGAPKLAASCVTTVQEGQVVHTEGERAKEMRQGVLEFYLANHPLDCPICDQSGECKLQDYVHAEGRAQGRYREPKRVFGRDDFGGDVLFYGDRCVMCTRCVRFMNEVAQDPRLVVVERGNRSIIDTFFEEGLAGSPYASNIVDICPVGALVSKDFLHKARAWDLDHRPSICPNCSQGCNVDLHVRDNLVQRMAPRANPDVNQYWICDYGRRRYEWLNRRERVREPRIAREGVSRESEWSEALTELGRRLEEAGGAGIRAVASSFSSNEDLAAFRSFVDRIGGGEILFRSPRADDEVPLPGFPRLTRRRDLAPNVRGAELMGMRRVGDDEAEGGLEDLTDFEGVLLVLGDELSDLGAEFGARARLFVHFAAHPSAASSGAHFLLPVTTFAEHEGTFTNHEGRVQRFWPALNPPDGARPAWQVLGALEARMGGGSMPRRADEAFLAAGRVSAAFQGLSYETLGARGAVVNEPVELPGG